MLKGLAKLDMVHVPYKGAGPAVQDIAGGQATMGIQDFAATAPFIQSGKLVPLAAAHQGCAVLLFGAALALNHAFARADQA